MKTIYPLGHAQTELTRLDAQADLLRDPLLEALASNASSCLEIGCGNGSNLPYLRQANPQLKYTGIDITESAIAAAKSRFKNDTNLDFQVMDATSMAELNDCSFDLVFTKLVLWSVGSSWTTVLREAFRLLSPSGIFYALEPCNHLVEMFPPRPAAKAWMNAWDKAALERGLNPYIGTDIAAGLKKAGFKEVESKFFPVIAAGTEVDRYRAIVENLEGFYMGPSAYTFGLPVSEKLKADALKELTEVTPDSLVTDAMFVAWGCKG